LTDGTLPHSRSFEDPDAMQEERRLFYVGITRAKDRLYLVYAQNRSAYGYAEPVEPSRMLDDIPAGLLEESQVMRSIRRPAEMEAERWQPAGKGAAPVLQPRFHPGMRVFHPTWSEGMVLNSRIQDDDEIVDIFFEEVGLKRVAASLARLEIRT
jgi:DNA helicase-2/ATP-dependent DNA helicase PcrA